MSRGEARRRDEGGGRYAFHVAEQMTPTALAVFPELTRAERPVGTVPAGAVPTGAGPSGTALEGTPLEGAPLEGTVLEGRVKGRVELYLILDRFALLGVTILEVQRLPD